MTESFGVSIDYPSILTFPYSFSVYNVPTPHYSYETRGLYIYDTYPLSFICFTKTLKVYSLLYIKVYVRYTFIST